MAALLCFLGDREMNDRKSFIRISLFVSVL